LIDAAIALADSVTVVNIQSCIIDKGIGIDSAMKVKTLRWNHCSGTIWQVVVVGFGW